ncbi:MAG: type II toxin-antitoxin system prevent-host-death family antitoxin [Pseudomonadota bacterium]
MAEFGVFEAKNRLSALLEMAERGEEVVITRNGNPVARLVDINQTGASGDVASVANDIREMRSNLPDDVLDGITIKEMIEEGRR